MCKLQKTAILNYNIANMTLLITSLGYFVDMFDMFLFNMLRIKSLSSFGLQIDQITKAGLDISNCQFAGFILGAAVSGFLGDKIGRKKMLYVSIASYALGSFMSAAAYSLQTYAISRFITGFGLAGELGIGITLITETLSSKKRGYGCLIFSLAGLLGVTAASFISGIMPWRMAYAMGGGLGFILLITRMLVRDPPMYAALTTRINAYSLKIILRKYRNIGIWIAFIFLMLPAVFVPQILWTLSPEIGRSLGLSNIRPSLILGIGFTAAMVGEMLAVLLSEKLQSRKKAALCFLTFGSLIFFKYMVWPEHSAIGFYIINALMGLSFGGWVLGSLWAAEQFGINIRATIATTIPNFARGLTIPMNLFYSLLKTDGTQYAIGTIGGLVFIASLLSLRVLPETYGRDLNFIEE